MVKTIYPASLITDFYKTAHKVQYPEGTTKVYSTFTPRGNKYFPHSDKVVVFAIQSFVKKYLMDYFDTHFFSRDKEEIVKEYSRIIKYAIGTENPDISHLEALHDLGYLPVKLKALKEGTLAPMQVPVLTIENTIPEFFWLTNYLETIMSSEIWMPMTSATTAKVFRNILDEYAIKTVGHTDDVDYQLHDFSFRGMSSFESAAASGAAHLTSFKGTDSIPSILYHEEYYNANVENGDLAGSVPATEHSTMVANTSSDERDEYEYIKKLITETYPTGIVSIVSDSYDFWDNVTRVYPKLKDEIMARNGKTVIRPDSGNPADILCGTNIEVIKKNKYIETLEDAKEDMREALEERVRNETPHGEYGDDSPVGEFKFEDKYYRIKLDISWDRHDKQYYYIYDIDIASFEEFTPSESQLGLVESLWGTFGGTVNELGYKVLDSHIGCIYGDSITIDLTKEICERLEAKGFASTNVVLGVGSFSYQMKTRDSFGFAMKATYAVVNGEERLLFKDPKTDQGKRSQRGLVAVVKIGDELHYEDGLNQQQYDANFAHIDQLEIIFEDGKLKRDETLSEIRSRLRSQ